MLRFANLLTVPKCHFSKVFPNYYGGEYVQSKATKFYPVVNPVTQEQIGKVPQVSQEEFNECVAKAKEAFKTWSITPLVSNYLYHFSKTEIHARIASSHQKRLR